MNYGFLIVLGGAAVVPASVLFWLAARERKRKRTIALYERELLRRARDAAMRQEGGR